jgi:hypothetical protein
MNLKKLQTISIVFFVSIVFFSCTTDDPVTDAVTDDDQVTKDEAQTNDEQSEDKTGTDEDTAVSDDIEVDEAVNDEAVDQEQTDDAVDNELSDDEGTSNLNTGDTSGQQAMPGNPGAACTKDEDCNNWAGTGNDDEQYAICLLPAEGYPQGYCSFMCDSSVALNHGCNGYNGVYYGWGTYGDGYCFHPCDDPNDCRVGYRCSQTVGACMPDCEVDACQKGACDETEKVCL